MTGAATSGMRLSIRGLPDCDLQAVEFEARIKQVKVGQVLVDQDNKTDALHVLLEGMILQAKVFPDGRRQITGLIVPGDCCDLFECMGRHSDKMYAATTDSTVAAWAYDVVLDWIDTRPAIARLLWRSARSREAILGEWLVNLGRRTPSERMAHLFCELLVRLQNVGLGQDDEYDFPLRQHELAEIVGLSTVHVNRTLQTLRADGLIALRNHRLKVLDFGRLKARAMFDPGYLEWTKSDLSLVPARA